jgi:outer membrane protein assembly factor BamB
MKRWFDILPMLLILLLFGCAKEDNGVDPSPPEPPGRQEGIQWPSLANSSWPMYHGDPQSTGRSKYFGPALGSIDWKIDDIFSETGVVIGADATIYFGATAGTQGPAALYAYRPDGTLKWRFELPTGNPTVRTTPLVAADGTIYIAGRQTGTIFAVKPDGTLRWEFSADSHVGQSGMNIGLDGSLYFVDGSNTLYSVASNGSLRWRLTDSRFYPDWHSVMTFSPDGSTLYVPGIGVCVLAVDVDSRSVRWTFGNSSFQDIAPMVDSQGHIYVLGVSSSHAAGQPSLFSLKPDGTIRWTYTHGNTFDPVSAGDPTIDINGNVYFAFDTLYSVDYSGNVNWKLPLNDHADSPLVCDLVGTVYVTALFQYNPPEMMAVNTDGSIKWRHLFDRYYGNDNSPALTEDAKLIFPTWRSSSVFGIR